MDVKHVAGFLLLFGVWIGAACVNVNETASANTTINTSVGCLYFVGSGITVNVTDALLNVSVVLNYSQNYTDVAHNITVRAPPIAFVNFTPINQTIQLRYNTCVDVVDPVARGFCEQVPANQALLNYTNDSLGLTVLAPPFPKGPKSLVVNPGEMNNDYLASYGFSVSCTTNMTPQVVEIEPKLNQHLEVLCGGTYTNNSLNFSLKALPYAVTDGGYITPPGLSCIEYNTTARNCTNIINVTTDAAGSVTEVCIDSLKTMCSSGEILDGNLINCFTRYTASLNKSYFELLPQYNNVTIQLNDLRNGMVYSKQLQQESNAFQDTLLWGVFLVVIIGIAAFGLKHFNDKKSYNQKRNMTDREIAHAKAIAYHADMAKTGTSTVLPQEIAPVLPKPVPVVTESEEKK